MERMSKIANMRLDRVTLNSFEGIDPLLNIHVNASVR
jgi:hypothetical protein